MKCLSKRSKTGSESYSLGPALSAQRSLATDESGVACSTHDCSLPGGQRRSGRIRPMTTSRLVVLVVTVLAIATYDLRRSHLIAPPTPQTRSAQQSPRLKKEPAR